MWMTEEAIAAWPAPVTVSTDEGWLYLAAIKDMATHQDRRLSMADHLKVRSWPCSLQRSRIEPCCSDGIIPVHERSAESY